MTCDQPHWSSIIGARLPKPLYVSDEYFLLLFVVVA